MYLEVLTGIGLLGIGYIAGRLDKFISGTKLIELGPRTTATATEKLQKKKIEIDDTKFVTQLESEKYEKGFKELGNKQTTSDTVGSAVNKLSKLKGK